MRVLLYNAKRYDRTSFDDCNVGHGHELKFVAAKLDPTTVDRATGFAAVCVFVNDDVGQATIKGLEANGVRVIALRCAGYKRQRRPGGRKRCRDHCRAGTGLLT